MLTAFKLSQLLLGVEVMLTLMDQFCDLYVVHEGFISVVHPKLPC